MKASYTQEQKGHLFFGLLGTTFGLLAEKSRMDGGPAEKSYMGRLDLNEMHHGIFKAGKLCNEGCVCSL